MTVTLAVCSETVFTDLPHIERVERLHSLGFAVELWEWAGRDADLLADTGAKFTSMTGYLSGDLVTISGSRLLLETAEQSIGFAKRLSRGGSMPALNLHGTGLGEGGLPVTPAGPITGAMWLAAYQTLLDVAALGAAHDVTFILENLNTEVDHPGVPFARASDTLALVEAVNSPHLRMNLDLYHAQIGEGNIAELIRRSHPHVGEIQVADVPGRCEPGTGEVRWEFIASVLSEVGFEGVVALEAFASQPGIAGSEVAVEAFRTAFTKTHTTQTTTSEGSFS